MVDARLVGTRLPTVNALVERGRLRDFRRMIGLKDPERPVAPPTYLFALEMLESDRPLAFLDALGIDVAKVLHTEQAFDYHAPVRAGDELVFESFVSDIFEKKGGALVFVVQETRVTNGAGNHVADMRRTFVVRG